MKMFTKIKELLNSDEINDKMNAVITLKQQLNTFENPTRSKSFHAYIRNLISWGVGNCLCNNLVTSVDELLNEILNCFLTMSINRSFYRSNLATVAVEKILQVTSLSLQNSDVYRKKNFHVTLCFSTILERYVDGLRARIHRISAPFITYIDQMLLFVEHLNGNQELDNIIRYSTLFSILLEYINDGSMQENIIPLFEKNYKNSLNSLCGILTERIDISDTLLLKLTIIKSMDIAIKICIGGLRLNENCEVFTNDTNDSPGIKMEQEKKMKFTLEITQFTFAIIVNKIIPNLMIIDKIQDDNYSSKILQNFAHCLILLFESKNIDALELSTELCKQYYLHYFYEKIINFNQIQRCKEIICECVFHILMIQVEHIFRINRWSSNMENFRVIMKDGLLKFMENMEILVDGNYPDVLLFWCYFHYHFTSDKNIINIIRRMSLTKKILSLSLETPPEIPVMQVIWLLFSILLVETDIMEASDEYLGDALKRIILLLNKLGIETCYIHHTAVLASVFQICVFPREIRNEVVKLSLRNNSSLTVVYELIGVEDKFDLIFASLMYCLSCNEHIVIERTIGELENLVLKYNCVSPDKMALFWCELPEILRGYCDGYEKSTEEYLKLLCNIIVHKTKFKKKQAIDCLATFIAVFHYNGDHNKNENIKLYTIILIGKILQLEIDGNEAFILVRNNKDFIKKLYAEIIQDLNDDLTIGALICLILILNNGCHHAVTTPVLLIKPNELFNLLVRKPSVILLALTFHQVIWTTVDKRTSIVKIDLNCDNVKQILYGIYAKLIDHFKTVPPPQWKLMFINLSGFHIFCRVNYPEVLEDLCDYELTLMKIDEAIGIEFTESEFFEFLKVWLQNALKCNCSFVEVGLELKEMREVGYSNVYVTMYEETLRRLEKFIVSLLDKKKIEDERVMEITQMLKLIL